MAFFVAIAGLVLTGYLAYLGQPTWLLFLGLVGTFALTAMVSRTECVGVAKTIVPKIVKAASDLEKAVNDAAAKAIEAGDEHDK